MAVSKASCLLLIGFFAVSLDLTAARRGRNNPIVLVLDTNDRNNRANDLLYMTSSGEDQGGSNLGPLLQLLQGSLGKSKKSRPHKQRKPKKNVADLYLDQLDEALNSKAKYKVQSALEKKIINLLSPNKYAKQRYPGYDETRQQNRYNKHMFQLGDNGDQNNKMYSSKTKRNPLVKQLLRVSNDINCAAKDECEVTCDDNYDGKKQNECEDECEQKYDCEEEKQERDEKDDCEIGDNTCGEEEEDKNISTRGERLETEKNDGCKRCKK